MEEVKLYVTAVCPFCQGPKEYIAENDLDVDIINITEEPKRRAELLDLGGKMQVPMLSIDGEAMYESADILDWLKNNM